MGKQERAAADYSADLLALRSHESFMRALMAAEPGSWLSVVDTAIRAGLPPPPSRGPAADLRATWLAHPQSADDSAVLVLFYSPGTMGSTVAVYNRERLRSTPG